MKSIINIIFGRFFNKLKYRGMYAIHSGDRAGGFFAYIKEENRGKSCAILFMPNPTEALYVKKEELKFDLKYGNIKYVSKLPPKIYDVVKVNFVYYAKKAGIYVNR